MKFPEWLPDRDEFDNPGLETCLNVIPDTFYRPILDLVAIGTAMTDVCLGAFSMKDDSSVPFNFAGDDTELYRLDSGNWTSIDTGFTTGAENRWQFVEFGTNCVATNLDDVMQVYDVEVDSSFAALAGTPPKAKYIGIVKDFLVAGHLSTSSGTVQWSGINDITEWTAGTAESGSQVLPEGGAITAVAGGEYGLIFQEEHITRMDYQGPPLNFSFSKVEQHLGTLAAGSVIQRGIFTYFLAADGFYRTDGTQSQSISPEKVDAHFYSKYDPTLPYKVTATVNESDKTITWSYVGLDSIDTLPNWLIIFNWELGTWSEASVRCELMFEALSSGLTLDGLDTLYPDIDAMTTSLDSNIFKGGVKSTSAINLSHQLATFTGDPLEGTLKTGEYELSEGQVTSLNEMWPLIDGTITVNVYTRNTFQDTAAGTGAIDVNVYGFAPFTEVGRYHSFEFKFTDWTRASGYKPKGVPVGGY
tara:strand:- start:26619 stop:28037 length:1419 start_codon:yes stop_codon:yes gene_type:complete